MQYDANILKQKTAPNWPEQQGVQSMARDWQIVGSDAESFDQGVGARASIGLIALSVDRASVADCRNWLAPFPGVELFVTRVPMSPVAARDTLCAMADHLGEATGRLVPGSRLDVLAFSCTSGLVAIGAARVRAALATERPDVPVVTPVEAGAKGLQGLGVRRLSILAPYHREAADLVAGHFEGAGFALDRCSTFDLDGDLQMNRLSAAALKAGAARALHPESDALFISCTGLRTAGIVAELEAELGVPVVTSNQAMSWDCLVTAGISPGDLAPGEGRLFGGVAA